MMRHRAFTLPELVLAISITAVIGLAAAGVAAALSSAHAQTSEMSQSIQSARTAMMRLQTLARKARLAPNCSGSQAVLWTGDGNCDGHINLAELVYVEYTPDDQMVRQWTVEFPADMALATRRALDVSVLLQQVVGAAYVRSLMSQAVYGSYLKKDILAVDVEDFSVQGEGPAPLTDVVRMSLSVGPANQRIALNNMVTLRSDVIDNVDMIDGAPVLDSSYLPTLTNTGSGVVVLPPRRHTDITRRHGRLTR